MKVEFKFDVGDEVAMVATKANGDVTSYAQGIVTMCGFDRGGKCYYVQNDKCGAWWHEDQLLAT